MLAALGPLAAAQGAAVAVVDVDADPALEPAFGDRVPVLFAGDPAGGAELVPFPPRPGAGRGGPGRRRGDGAIEVASGAKIR